MGKENAENAKALILQRFIPLIAGFQMHQFHISLPSQNKPKIPMNFVSLTFLLITSQTAPTFVFTSERERKFHVLPVRALFVSLLVCIL